MTIEECLLWFERQMNYVLAKGLKKAVWKSWRNVLGIGVLLGAGFWFSWTLLGFVWSHKLALIVIFGAGYWGWKKYGHFLSKTDNDKK